MATSYLSASLGLRVAPLGLAPPLVPYRLGVAVDCFVSWQRDIPHCGHFLFVRFARTEGRPCRALSLFIQSYPRVWSPFQGYAPWALKGSPL